MDNTRISELIAQEVEGAKKDIKISEVSTFDHYDTVNKINNYKNDKFHKNAEPRAIFWNLAKPRIPHFVKKFKLKPKNFRIYAKGANNFFQSWIINQKFQYWARNSNFTIDLEDLKYNASEYGVAVMKLVDEGSAETLEGELLDKYNLKACYLTKLYYDTSIENIIDSNIIEKHELTEAQIRKKMDVWGLEEEDIEHIKKHAEKDSQHEDNDINTRYVVYERHGDWKEGEDDMYDEDKKSEYWRHVVTGSGDNELILYKEKLERDDCPYIDFPLGNYEGRHIRVGVYERLFGLQERVNQLVNENKAASTIASLLLLKSQEEDLVGTNLITQAVSGQVLNTADLEQVAIDNRFINNFLNELLMIEKQADLLCNTPDIAGSKDPESAPVRSRILAINEINSAFDSIRDRIAFKLSKVLIQKIMPAIVADWNKEDMMEIAETAQDMKIYDFYYLNSKITEYIKSEWAKGNNPSEEEKQAFVAKQIERLNVEGRRIEKMKGFFNFDYGFYLNPTDSDMDRAQLNEAMNFAITSFMQNPAISEIPLFQQYLENNNIPPFRLTLPQMQQYQESQVGGGGQTQESRLAQKPDKLLSQVNNKD